MENNLLLLHVLLIVVHLRQHQHQRLLEEKEIVLINLHMTVNQVMVNVHKILIVLENGAHVMRIVVQPSVFQLDRVDKGQSVRQLLVLQGVVLQATVHVQRLCALDQMISQDIQWMKLS